MRNPNGYGSVYKLSGNRRKPYTARITVDWDINGYPKYKFIGYFETKKEAMLCLAKFNENPYDVDMQKSTVADMWEIFKERKFKDDTSKSKINIYKAGYKHLQPIHNIEIKKLKTYHIQKIIDNLENGYQSKSHIVMLIGQLFDIAIELDICNKNYAKFVDIGEKTKSTLHKPFTDEEIKALWDNVFIYNSAVYALLLIYTGLRPTELISIKTDNVFLNERYMIGGSKTKAGKDRIIPINEKIYPLICKIYNPETPSLIYYRDFKRGYDKFKKDWDREMQLMGLDHLPHDGRHTFASLMDTAGANKLSIKKIMGHSISDITDGVYTHKHVDELLNAVNMI